jgi:hypothetical protein
MFVIGVLSVNLIHWMQAAGEAKPSFLAHHLEGRSHEGDSYLYKLEDIKGAAGVMYVGGAETVCYTNSRIISLF